MGFGLCNAPSSFARVINLILRGLNWKIVLAFLDDILVMGKTVQEHLSNLEEVLMRLKQFGLKLKPKKCCFFQKEVEFLGRTVSGDTLAMTKEDVQVIENWPTPKFSKEVEKFMGLANYHRGFVKNFSKLAEPLYSVVGKNKFHWGSEQQTSFEALKNKLTSPPILALARSEGEFVLDTDASNNTIGAELSQTQDGQLRVIAYGSYSLTAEQRRYCTTRKELLAIVRFTRQFRHYLLGKPFVVRTDHSSLTWLINFKEPQGQLARWLEELSQYNIILKYRAGKLHANSDALSRIPHEESTCNAFKAHVALEDLPCGGCKYCKRAEEQWGTFMRDVDEAVPLKAQIRGRESEPGSQSTGTQLQTVPGTPIDQSRRRDCGTSTRSAERGASAEIQSLPDGQVKGKSGKSVSDKDERNVEVRSVELQQLVDHWANHPWDPGENAGPYVTLSVTDESAEVQVCSIQIQQPESTKTCWGYDWNDVQEAQAKDENLTFIRHWIQDNTVPKEGDLFLASKTAKAYWLNKERFTLTDGILYYQREDDTEKDLVVPISLQMEVLRTNHDIPSAGHQGVARTTARIKEKFYWYSMDKTISSYIASCRDCSQNKKSGQYGHAPMQQYQASAPMERVHLDFMGPLPKTARGNEYVLMMVDQFTKWVECVPLPSQTAEMTAKAAVDNFFSRFGCPFQIFTDQGRNFESKLFTALTDALEIHKARTTPYRPSANGQVERFNRTLMDAVRCYISGSQEQWDLHLPQIAGAMRSAVNRSTGFSANMLMLGREVNTPAYLMFPTGAPKQETPEQYVATLTTNIQAAHETARVKLKTSLERMKRDYDVRILQRCYGVGDVVYVLDTAVRKGQSKKLSSPWKGPAVITKKVTSSLYQVKTQRSVFMINHDRLKPCQDRNLPRWIKEWKDKPDISEEDQDGEYCLCRGPSQGRFMIQCDGCDEWYHGSCINITASEAIGIDKYWCPICR